jgi:hypothetical protein
MTRVGVIHPNAGGRLIFPGEKLTESIEYKELSINDINNNRLV